MSKVKVLYCIDGYNTIEIPIGALSELLSTFQKIVTESSSVIKTIFTADVVVEGAGRISGGLNQKCILAYTSEDSEETLTSLGDEEAEGDTLYYFGDYTRMSNKYIISFDDAIEVLKVWIESGKLSDSIKWTDKHTI